MDILDKEKFKSEGYIIFKNLIDSKLIDNLINAYNNFKLSNSIYYSQSEHNWRNTKEDLDDYSLLNCSIENFTNLIWSRSLSKSGREILQSETINKVLKGLSSNKEFCMWQNMLFDKSTGTVDHLDSWYLDTNPIGNLIAVWIALEDIHEDGGSFHIYPESHLNKNRDWGSMHHKDFLLWINNFSKTYKKKSIYLKKGDALFWHPLLIHGSSSQKVPGKSRKSITAHYYPINMLKGGKGKNDYVDNNLYKKMIEKQKKSTRTFGYPIRSNYSKRIILKSSIGGLLKYFTNFKNRPYMLMNRIKNKFL